MKLCRIACTPIAATAVGRGAAEAAQAADIAPGRERYGVYSTDAERRQKADGPADRTDGCECCPEGRGHALGVHFG